MFKSKYTVGDLRDFLMNSPGDGLTLDVPNKLSGANNGYVFIIDINSKEHDDDEAHVYIYDSNMPYELWLNIDICHDHIQISWPGNEDDIYVYAESNKMKDAACLDPLFESYLDDFDDSCAYPTRYNTEEEKIKEFAQFIERCIDMYKAGKEAG